MTTLMDGHVRLDERGVAYVGGSRLKLIHLVMTYRGEEGGLEGVRKAYDWLPESDLYAALAYYLDHQSEVDQAIQDYHDRSEKARAAAGESELAKRLKALRTT